MKRFYFISLFVFILQNILFAGWLTQTSGTSNELYDVYFIDQNNGWAVGKWGTIKHTTNSGSQWSTQTSNTTKWIKSVYFTNQNNGWNCTEMSYPYAGEIFFYNGSSWSSQYFPPMGQPGQFSSIYMLNNNNGWACGGDDIFHYNGSSWNPQSSGVTNSLNEIWFTDSNNGWVVGSSGTILHYNGSGWASQSIGGYIHLNSVSFVDNNNGWAVGNQGTIYNYNGSSWSQQTSNTTADLNGVHFITSSNGYAVGSNGTILHYDGNSWSVMSSGTTNDLNSVFFPNSQNGWAVGENGTILKYECTMPGVPVATAATNVTQVSFNANWNTASNADGYYLDVAIDNGFTNFVSGYNNLNVGNVTTYNVSGLTENTDYYYRLRAYNTCGTSGNSNVISLTSLPNAPSAPSATAATNITQSSFDANWDASTGADGYYLDVATDNGFTNFVSGYNNLNVGNVTIYNVTGLTASTDYYFRVRAYNSGGTSGNSNVISVTTLPNAPSAPNTTAATNITQTTFDANWNASSGADGYYLDVATDNGFTNFVSGYNSLNVGNVTTYNVTGLTASTDYYYRVRAYNTGGTSGNSNVISVTTLPNAPLAPNATTATNITQTTFDANWDASSGSDGYYLDVATDNGFTNFVSGYNNINVGNVTTYNVTGLTASTDYYYRIRAYNTGGTSGNSNVISLTTLVDPPPAPNATAATNIQQIFFDANWDTSTGADGYYLDVATDNGFTNFVSGYNNLNVGNVTTYTVSGLAANTEYFYRIRAFNIGGTSGNSNVINVTTLPYNPNAPIANPATNVQQTSFNTNWEPVPDAITYYLDVAYDIDFTNYVSGYENLNVGNVTTYNVSGLTANTDYYYRVRAENAGGISGNSNIIFVTTLPYPPLPPQATNATNISQTSFDANWEESGDSDGYCLDVALDDAFTNFVSGYENLNVGNITTYNVSGLNPNTLYYYRVRAYNLGGTSGNSNTISVITLTTGIDDHNNITVQVYNIYDHIYIRIKGTEYINAVVNVFNLSGKKIINKEMNNSILDFPVFNKNSVFIVQVVIDKKTYTRKIFVFGR